MIPDHEVLRRIGGGAYGEVWLARGVTGALRAVKVVWRDDFEDERGFEREFEGILKFEPVSRDHPALMNILHVGRGSGEPPFYYCVMELGDDVRNGREINPIDYEPRTLRGDVRAAAGKPLEVRTCIDVGLRLSEALEHLHEAGLAHRDVKPSNVIFVGGKAKLADIGLVAARGQRTFVGTEGFVPPEGPGSARADVYSLGKVLYECATGMDRLDFPESPDELPQGADLKLWQELNRVICEVCEPHASRRRIQTAAELAEALRTLKRGRRPRLGTRLGTLVTTVLVGVVLLVGGWEALRKSPWGTWINPGRVPVEEPGTPGIGKVRITSYPEGADVFDEDGLRIGTTPTAQMDVAVGERVCVTVRKEGFRPFVIDAIIGSEALEETITLWREMEVYAPPEEGQPWVDHVGMRYQPVNSHHVASSLVPVEIWRQFVDDSGWKGKSGSIELTESGEKVTVAVVAADAAADYCEWMTDEGVRLGYLTEDFLVRPGWEETADLSRLPEEQRAAGMRPFRPVVEPIRYATLVIKTEPAGAEVYIDGVPVGSTAGKLEIGRLRPEVVQVQILLEGYLTKTFQIELGPNQRVERSELLEPNQSVVMTRPWENGLGMRFVPVDKDLMASVWETRVRDYDEYAQKGDGIPPLKPYFEQAPDHPVVYVSRDEAQAFCRWLTSRERNADRITLSHEYRLPTDLEWSLLVGLRDDADATPAERSARAWPSFPWGPGALWPPGPLTGPVGNLADEAALRMPGISPDRVITGYDDGFAATAPVGSFPANSRGLFDLSGNVHEWVSSDYGQRSSLAVLRGGGWNTYEEENLYSGARNTAPPTGHDNIYGFRVMLARVPAEPPPETGDESLFSDGNVDPETGESIETDEESNDG